MLIAMPARPTNPGSIQRGAVLPCPWERLRERFYSAGPDTLSDYELLEMALFVFAARPRRDA
jgi:DNA repair protein RadC